MFIKRGDFLIQICRRSSPYLRNHSLILNLSASFKLPSRPPPPNPPPAMDSPTTTPRSVTKHEVASSQTLPPNSPPVTDSSTGTSRSSANKEDATNYAHNFENLWKNVVVLKCESSSESGSCNVYLVGTCHVSTDSCKEVQAVIKHIKPQAVFLELCPNRISILTTQALKVPTMQQMIVAMWKKKRANAFGIALSYFYAKVGEKLNVLPGAEFRVAYEEARSYGARIVLGDRPFHITLRRALRNISLWHCTKSMYHIFFRSSFMQSSKDIKKMMNLMRVMDSADLVRRMVQETSPDMVKLMIQDLSKMFPTLVETLINERDMYMSSSLLQISKLHSSVVAVVGKAHLPGIVKHWKQPIDAKRLMEIPTKNVGIFGNKASIATGLALATGLYFICMRLH